MSITPKYQLKVEQGKGIPKERKQDNPEVEKNQRDHFPDDKEIQKRKKGGGWITQTPIIVFLSLPVNTSGRLYDNFIRFLSSTLIVRHLSLWTCGSPFLSILSLPSSVFCLRGTLGDYFHSSQVHSLYFQRDLFPLTCSPSVLSATVS